MKLTEVKDRKSEKEFLKVPLTIYKNDPNWIRPLDQDIEAIFDPEKNQFHQHGEICRWILKDNDNRLIGRVAAFIDYKQCNSFDQPTGGMGFFECINNSDAAFKLFDTCKNWLETRGMEAMDGPVNFGEKDRFWGLLVEGFHQPTYCINYNPSYYRQLFETYGFKTYYEQLTYLMDLEDPLPKKYKERAISFEKNEEYRFEHISKKQIHKYIESFRNIYNEAWSAHDNFKKMSESQARSLLKKLKPAIDEKLIWFAYHHNKPVAFLLMLPELNHIFKYVNGKMNLIGKLKFLWHMWKGSSKRIHGIAFGIIPAYQKTGIESGIFKAASDLLQLQNQYNDFELTWIGDFNPKMIAMARSLNARVYKKHLTLRYLFDTKKEFKRAPVINNRKKNAKKESKLIELKAEKTGF